MFGLDQVRMNARNPPTYSSCNSFSVVPQMSVHMCVIFMVNIYRMQQIGQLLLLHLLTEAVQTGWTV